MIDPQAGPDFVGDLDLDATSLAKYTARCEDVVARYPSRIDRDAGAQRSVDQAFAAARTARRAFLARHADAVYSVLTSGLARHRRLPELVHAAAERFPGLVPTATSIADERGRIQAERDGREIDQAIFCAAILRSPRSGSHLIDAMRMPTAPAIEVLDIFRRTGKIELSSVAVERVGHAAYLTFRDGHPLNAENDQLVTDTETAVDLALLDDEVRVGVLRGGPSGSPRYQGKRVFSAGMNLTDLRNGRISFVEFLLGRELGFINKIMRGLFTDARAAPVVARQPEKPWIGAVDAFAIGGGMQLLLVLDRVIAEEGAFFSLPAAEEGIVPGLANLRLSRAVGSRMSRRIILSGLRIAATDRAAELICDEVVPAEEMDAAITAAVAELSQPAVVANRRMLILAEEPVDLYRWYLAEFAIVQAERMYSPDVLGNVERRWQESRRRKQVGGNRAVGT
ncbi:MULTISPECIES: enoyl-CoA hydratase/isomerase family protein [Nocardia]|uniref:enoyl-CoA hydratase/isomerase family protein n=1 Tax=Nocardia TaxID=1817 RepID=UPI001358BA7F|nr:MULTISPECIES: enoyl-CoA hydratase/isomerase family protein [Nocardia]